jgi:hypothetical protein
MDAGGVGFVKMRRKRHFHGRMNIHPPYFPQILPLDENQCFPQRPELVERPYHYSDLVPFYMLLKDLNGSGSREL